MEVVQADENQKKKQNRGILGVAISCGLLPIEIAEGLVPLARLEHLIATFICDLLW